MEQLAVIRGTGGNDISYDRILLRQIEFALFLHLIVAGKTAHFEKRSDVLIETGRSFAQRR
jgi:hypothetical protein